MVPITEGLDGSETYIVDGMLRARPGMPVTPDTMANTPEATAPVESETAQVETAGEDG